MGMAQITVFLVQFIATVSVTAGGMAILISIVNGEHSTTGWLIFIFGLILLVVGSSKLLRK